MNTSCDDATNDTTLRGPLAGVRILDLTTVVLGPFATQILAQLGADVIKVEPAEGDTMRHVGPMRNPGMGHLFLNANAGKRSVALNLKHPQGLEAALRLAQSCDVLISNVRPQAMARLGLDYDAVRQRNPRIIHVSCCGFDQRGPDAARPAYDDLIQGATGIAWLTQRYGAAQPGYAPLALADRVTGLHAVYAVTAALYARERTGVGQAVVVPMFEALSQFVLSDHMAGLTFNPPLGEPGYARLLTRHRRPYETRDGMLCVLIYNDKHWRNFFAALDESGDLACDPRFATHGARAQHIDAVYAEVARLMRTRTTAEWRALLDAADVPNMPMHSPADLLDDPQLQASGFVRKTQHPTEGEITTLAAPTHWSHTAPPVHLSPAPRLGQDTRQVLAELGYSAADIDTLLADAACEAADVGSVEPRPR